VGARQFQVAAALAGPLTGPAAVDVPPITTPFEFGFGQIGHEVVLELAGGFQVAGAAKRAPLGTDVVFDEDGAGRRIGAEGSGVLTVLLASAVGARPLGRVPTLRGALTAPADVLQLVLDLGQPTAQVGVLRLQVGDPLFEGGEMGQDSGLGLRRDPIPERYGDRRSGSHTLTTRLLYRKFGHGMAPVARKARAA
jgi:hypothetical protein